MTDDADELYALPLDEFTRARNELAKRIGDAEIRQLKKPSVSAWAVNQLTRRREVDMRRLLRAGERLEKAQKGVFGGGGDPRAFAESQREQRDAVRRLRSEAAEILRDAGHPASDATLERLATTLHAAAGTEEGRTLLRTGRLSEDVEPLGFTAIEGVVPPPSKRGQQKRGAEPPRANPRLEKARADLAAARAEAESTEKAAKEAAREADRAHRAAERAADRVARLEARIKELTH